MFVWSEEIRKGVMRLSPNLLLVVSLTTAVIVHGAEPASAPGADQGTRARLLQTLRSMPLRFEETSGVHDPEVKYLARGPGYTLFLAPTQTVLTIQKNEETTRVHRSDKEVA